MSTVTTTFPPPVRPRPTPISRAVDAGRAHSSRLAQAAHAYLTQFRFVRWLLVPPRRGWIGPIAVTIFAAIWRFVRLGVPRELVFDETYYVKQAYSLLALGYEGRWAEDANEGFVVGDYSGLSADADYVVHPPVGKWLIAFGMRIFGSDNPFGWRFAAALFGTLTVLIVARATTRLLGSSIYGTGAGLLLAVDGLHIVQSRTGLLDIFLAFFVVAAFAALLLDRDRKDPERWFRPWLVTGGVLLGLACGVKWSGAYFVAAFGLLVVAWDVARRYKARTPRWFLIGTMRDGVAAFVQLVPVALIAYVASWGAWFAQPSAYFRQWAANNPGEGVQWLPEALRSLWHYHQQMWSFHVGLSSEHGYMSQAWTWLFQLRPTSYYFNTPEQCDVGVCSEAITSVGNPLLWWGGCIALVIAAIVWIWWNDNRGGAILVGIAAGWLPWFSYADRTIFTFYAVVIAPFLAMLIAYVISLAGRPPKDAGARVAARVKRRGYVVLATVCLAAIAIAVFFYPVWTAVTIPREAWELRMWLHSWI